MNNLQIKDLISTYNDDNWPDLFFVNTYGGMAEVRVDMPENLDELVEKCVELTYYYASARKVNGVFSSETIPNKWRSSKDIWRHVKRFLPGTTLPEVMDSLYRQREKFVGHFCGDIKRRVFKHLDVSPGSSLLDKYYRDEYYFLFYDWKIENE